MTEPTSSLRNSDHPELPRTRVVDAHRRRLLEEQFHTMHSGLVLHVHERVRLALPTPSSTGAGIGGGNRRYCDKKEFACGGHHPYDNSRASKNDGPFRIRQATQRTIEEKLKQEHTTRAEMY